MKLIESKAEYIPQEEGLEGIYKAIELAGRTAYHSQDKITPDYAKGFVDRMIKSHHGACLEHGTVYFNRKVDYSDSEYLDFEEFFDRNSYSKVDYGGGILYVVTNFRVIEENFNLKDFWNRNIQYLCSPTEFHEKRYTMRFTCSRAIANELVRHRTMSFLQESTRYINYSKERHGGEITFIIPSWDYKYNDNQFEGAEDWNPYMRALNQAESSYFEMIDDGCTPQQARDVLPNATKTELIMTGFVIDWRHVFDLRLFEKTGKVAPDMLDLMQKAQKSMQEAGIWEDIMRKPSKFK
jgi:thymidylate synthase (FAD)